MRATPMSLREGLAPNLMMAPERLQHSPELDRLIARIGDIVSARIILALRDGPRRSSRLKRELKDIPRQILTDTLAALERKGVIVQRMFATIPPQVTFELTKAGSGLLEPAAT